MWGEFCETYSPASKDDNMISVIRDLIRQTESKIIKILEGSYNSGVIDDAEKFIGYELEEIKKLLFMRNELDEKLYELMEGEE